MPTNADTSARHSFIIPDIEPLKISYVSIAAQVEKANLRDIFGMPIQNRMTESDEANVGSKLIAPRHVIIPEAITAQMKIIGQTMLSAHFLFLR